ncbi:MAG: family 10 glycosylhydrolase [Candidatus Aminicenantales bacterium]
MREIIIKIIIIFISGVLIISCSCENRKEKWGKGIWVHPRDLGQNEKEVEEFFRELKKCSFTIVFPLVKGTGGKIFWHSEKFSEAIHPDYRDFDLLRAAAHYARKYKIKIHPWLCDFPEGKNSPAFRKHPEWAMLNPDGGYTDSEKLGGGRPYSPVWMCPAQRPGYADEWLIPMIEEIVSNYKVDGIHHDYVRYPGDVAPDSYCFCDYCLEHYLSYNHLYYPSRPDDRIELKLVLPRKEANWHYDLTSKPENWASMSRREKAEFLLEGRTINRQDMDYFFYETRCDIITRFVREATERARLIKPEIEFSAAVFINPMRSGRNIGQRWTDFIPWIDFMIPMNYRSHFQGSFEDYLAYLKDYIKAQKRWCRGESILYSGITGHYIYREEREPWEKAGKVLENDRMSDSQKQEFRQLMEKNIEYLSRFSSQRAGELKGSFESYLEGSLDKKELREKIRAVLSDPPEGFFPGEKLIRTIETVKKAGAEGVVIFSAGIITRNKLWPALEKLALKEGF